MYEYTTFDKIYIFVVGKNDLTAMKVTKVCLFLVVSFCLFLSYLNVLLNVFFAIVDKLVRLVALAFFDTRWRHTVANFLGTEFSSLSVKFQKRIRSDSFISELQTLNYISIYLCFIVSYLPEYLFYKMEFHCCNLLAIETFFCLVLKDKNRQK